MITEETIARMKQNLEVKNEFFVLDVIKHLEKQIEKMKCCQNCKYYTCLDDEEHLYGCKKPNDCECFEKWELGE